MRKLLLAATALPMLAGPALAEPLKLDENGLAGVAAGQSFDLSISSGVSSTMNTSVARNLTADLASSSSNTNHAIGLLGSQSVTATGSATSMVVNTVAGGAL